MMSAPPPKPRDIPDSARRYHLAVDGRVNTIEGKSPERIMMETMGVRRGRSVAYKVAIYDVWGGDRTYKNELIEHTNIWHDRPTILYYDRRDDALHHDGRPADFWEGT